MPVQTEDLYVDDDGYYFLNVYVGSNLQARQLLLDTQANGTAVKYNYRNSLGARIF